MSTNQTAEFTPEARPFLAASKGFSDATDSPRAFLERCIEVIDAQEARIGAFVATNLEAARAAAAAAVISPRLQRGLAGNVQRPPDIRLFEVIEPKA